MILFSSPLWTCDFILSNSDKRTDYEIDPQQSNGCAGAFAEPEPTFMKGTALQQAFYLGGGTPGHGNGHAMTDAEQHNEEDARYDFLLDGDDGKNRSNEAERAGTRQNPIGQSKGKRTRQAFDSYAAERASGH